MSVRKQCPAAVFRGQCSLLRSSNRYRQGYENGSALVGSSRTSAPRCVSRQSRAPAVPPSLRAAANTLLREKNKYQVTCGRAFQLHDVVRMSHISL